MTADIFIPQSDPKDALVGPLHTVTLFTSAKEQMDRALLQGYGLSSSGWQTPDQNLKSDVSGFFQLEGDLLEHTLYTREGAGRNIQLRVFTLDSSAPVIRPSYEGLYKGGATISFPIADLSAHEAIMAELGFRSTIGVKKMDFQSPSGETYTAAEIVYEGPDNVFFLGVTRPSIFVPVGPMDTQAGMGGAAYSARCISETQETLTFFRDVLGYEIRRDVEFSVEGNSAINLPSGTTERFIQGFAPGASTGYVVLMDHGDATKVPDHGLLGPPAKGIGIWSFPTKDINEVYRRAKTLGCDIVHKPSVYPSLYIDTELTMLLRDPDGFFIEVFQSSDINT